METPKDGPLATVLAPAPRSIALVHQAAGQLDVDLREQLGVDQRAMLDALRSVDAKANAERIEAVLRARMPRGESSRTSAPVIASACRSIP